MNFNSRSQSFYNSVTISHFLSLSHTHTLTHTHTRKYTHSCTRAHTHTLDLYLHDTFDLLTYLNSLLFDPFVGPSLFLYWLLNRFLSLSLSLSANPLSFTHAHTLSLSLTPTLTHTPTHMQTHAHTQFSIATEQIEPTILQSEKKCDRDKKIIRFLFLHLNLKKKLRFSSRKKSDFEAAVKSFNPDRVRVEQRC